MKKREEILGKVTIDVSESMPDPEISSYWVYYNDALKAMQEYADQYSTPQEGMGRYGQKQIDEAIDRINVVIEKWVDHHREQVIDRLEDIIKEIFTSPLEMERFISDQTFITYLSKERDLFVRAIQQQEWKNELRTAAEDLLIAFDQVRQRYIDLISPPRSVGDKPETT